MMELVFWIVGTLVACYVVFMIVRRVVPTFGTLITNTLMGFAGLLDVLQTLPWGSALDGKTAGAVIVGLSMANGLMRLHTTKPVGGDS